MPALGGASAQPLRHLDFLIRDPVRSVLLHGGGVPVTVPAPERYCVHKILLSTERQAQNLDPGRWNAVGLHTSRLDTPDEGLEQIPSDLLSRSRLGEEQHGPQRLSMDLAKLEDLYRLGGQLLQLSQAPLEL